MCTVFDLNVSRDEIWDWHIHVGVFAFFIGIARLMTESRHDGHHVPWVLPPGISQSQLGGVFKLDWIHKYVIGYVTLCVNTSTCTLYIVHCM